MDKVIGTISCWAILGVSLFGQTPELSSHQKKQVLDTLVRELCAQYIFPEKDREIAESFRARVAENRYHACHSGHEFAKLLTVDLKALSQDSHLQVTVDPAFNSAEEEEDRVPTAAELEKMKEHSARMAHGVTRVERLPGNVAYVEVIGFGPPEIVSGAYSSAFQLTAGADALILDLRQNGGGDPASVACLLSHLFPPGDARQLKSVRRRSQGTERQYWILPTVQPRYTGPVYVLISKNTFSGREECAYDLKAQQRAILVGECTKGGANPDHAVAIGEDLTIFIPTGQAVNPITKSNWDKVGVMPEISVDAKRALEIALCEANKRLINSAETPERKRELQNLLERANKS